MNINKKFKTRFVKGAIEEQFTFNLFYNLKNNIQWQDGVYSKINGFTRKAYSLNINEIPDVDVCILYALDKLSITPKRVYGY